MRALTLNGTYFGVDFILYLVLIFLATWRHFFPFQRRRGCLDFLNYCNLLYAFLLFLLVFLLDSFIRAVVQEFRASQKTNIAMLVVFVMVPLANIVTLGLSWRQTRQHIHKMREGVAISKHDRVVQIIALPAVYGLMAMCALVKLYHEVTHELQAEEKGIVFARYETCMFVGDLYEAWALYQFGTLTFELLDATVTERQSLMSGWRKQKPASGSRDVALTFKAVSSLAWLGTWLFVVICILQAGWSLWLWTFHEPSEDWAKYGAEMKKFSYAGLIASGAAVYNVHTIESTFGHMIQGYSPLLKFLSVKLLVFFAFWQLKFLLVLKSLSILHLSDLQIKMLHAALLVFECLGSAVVHVRAWSASEEWYTDDEDPEHSGVIEEGPDAERKPLVDKTRQTWHH